MYKKLLTFIVITIFAVLIPSKVFAHPIDNTDTFLYFESEVDGTKLLDNEIKAYAYLNWFQAAMLVEREHGVVASDVFELIEYQDTYEQYILNHLKVSNNNSVCIPELEEAPVLEDDFSLSLGSLAIVSFICEAKIQDVKIENSLFLSDFEYQSNFTEIYVGDRSLHKFTMDRDFQIYEFNAENLKQNPKGDETVDNSANLSAGEVVGDSSNSRQENAESSSSGPKKISFLTGLTDALFLKTNAIKDQSIIFLLALVFALGFLHTIEAGHSKAILASSMLHKKMDVKKGLSYALVFTITHLADIIIIGLILLAADNYFNILSNFSMIERFAGYALFFMSIYLLLKNSQYLLSKWFFRSKSLEIHTKNNNGEHEHGPHTHQHYENDENITFKDQLILGFLAGLAPCVFGWSIFMLILSTNNTWVLVPAILSFGLGIFVALAFVVFILSHLKKGAYGRFEKIAEISPLISALFLFGYSLLLVF